jgi:beta-glucosidase/6-phospho-beta-glucosidase/beta-galactosidase
MVPTASAPCRDTSPRHRRIKQSVDLRGYLTWPLQDNSEWAYGCTRDRSRESEYDICMRKRKTARCDVPSLQPTKDTRLKSDS